MILYLRIGINIDNNGISLWKNKQYRYIGTEILTLAYYIRLYEHGPWLVIKGVVLVV